MALRMIRMIRNHHGGTRKIEKDQQEVNTMILKNSSSTVFKRISE
jgi:hypothetical protein